MGILKAKNKETKWSFEKEWARCKLCGSIIEAPWWYTVSDPDGKNMGPHHLLCAERVVKNGGYDFSK